MTIVFLVSLNKKTVSVEQLRETREGFGTWPSPPALTGKCAEEDIYTINRK